MVGQGTIVAAGAIAYPPGFAHAPDSTLKSLSIEKVMTMTSTYDHRIIQGAQSGEFLNRIDELLNGASTFLRERSSRRSASRPRRARRCGRRQRRRAVVRAAARGARSGELAGMPSEEMLRGDRARARRSSRPTGRHGHLAAHRSIRSASPPPGDPSLDPATYNLTPR